MPSRPLTTLVVVQGCISGRGSSKKRYLQCAKLFFAAHHLNLPQRACPYTYISESPSISKPQFVFNSVTRSTTEAKVQSLHLSISWEREKNNLILETTSPIRMGLQQTDKTILHFLFLREPVKAGTQLQLVARPCALPFSTDLLPKGLSAFTLLQNLLL